MSVWVQRSAAALCHPTLIRTTISAIVLFQCYALLLILNYLYKILSKQLLLVLGLYCCLATCPVSHLMMCAEPWMRTRHAKRWQWRGMLVVFSEARRSKRRETELWCVEEVFSPFVKKDRRTNFLMAMLFLAQCSLHVLPRERAAITNACVQLDCLSLWFPFRFLG